MVRKVKWTTRALQDLRNIHDYIARDSRRYARLQVERIRDAAANLAFFPLMGRNVPELPDSGFKEVISGNFRVIYRFDESDNRILVMSVMHGRRMLENCDVI
ncbi:MAG: type II toxin-antitoxin system RelE/ParE family toxin [Nitrospirae bacterium]|nr:type II toxin-antitoxin system RelE/ParE family toxin [Nitrospirota bacterium]